ncbi:MAG: tyrosine-type recombinase/integrase [Aliarcobacter sp.]|mgnify:CR=1 FL=1|nr:tyrosine-type recombinase/integrase [Aliarcobacter sp.]
MNNLITNSDDILITVNNFSEWLKMEGRSSNTIKEYVVILQKFINWFKDAEYSENFASNNVTVLHLHNFISFLDKIEKYEPAYINKIIASLKTFFKYETETQHISYNPMLKVKMKRTMKQYSAPKWLTKQESAKFFHSIEQEKNEIFKARNMAVCRLMAGAGLRVHEVSDLNLSDICLESRKENVTVRSGKGGKYRIVPLNSDVAQSLKNWIKYRSLIVTNNSESLFLSERLTTMSDRTIRYMVSKYALAAKIDNISPHILRHSFCKSLIDQGYGLQIIAHLAGHESLETTRRYTQPGDIDLRKAVETISEKK